MLCPNCKKEIENDSKFCEHCGARVKKSKKWLWVALAVTLIVGGAIVVWDIVDTSGTFYETAEDYRIIGSENQGFVDLGLPSGTCWRNYNEDGYYAICDYDEAVSVFGNMLPTKQQFEELKNECEWTWFGDGYMVTGPNGNSIYLPAAGYRSCFGGVDYVGTNGYYWSSTPNDSYSAWYFAFDSSEVSMHDIDRCYGYSVRLVQ